MPRYWEQDEEGNWTERDDDEESGGDGEDSGGGSEGDGGESGGGDGGGSGWEAAEDAPVDVGGDSGWAELQEYEEAGRRMRRNTDWGGTSYYEDLGAWGDRGGGDDGGLDRDVLELHRFYDPYELTDYDDDEVRRAVKRGVASDGMRFDDLDEPTRGLFGATYGEDAARRWAEEHTREIADRLRRGQGIRLPSRRRAPSSRRSGPGGPTARLDGLPRAPFGVRVVGAVDERVAALDRQQAVDRVRQE